MGTIRIAKLLAFSAFLSTQLATKLVASPVCNDINVNQRIQQLGNLEDSDIISLSGCGLKIVPKLLEAL